MTLFTYYETYISEGKTNCSMTEKRRREKPGNRRKSFVCMWMYNAWILVFSPFSSFVWYSGYFLPLFFKAILSYSLFASTTYFERKKRLSEICVFFLLCFDQYTTHTQWFKYLDGMVENWKRTSCMYVCWSCCAVCTTTLI